MTSDKSGVVRVRTRQLFNFLTVIFSYIFSAITKKVIHWGMPVAAGIEPSNHCNLKCPECPSGTGALTRSRGNLDLTMFRSIIDQLPQLSYLSLYFQGEPFMNRNLFDFIAYARLAKIYVAISTNGHFFTETTVSQTIRSGLNKLIISFDGFSQASYEQYRIGGDFQKVADGIRLICNEKKRMKSKLPEIELQCLVLKSTENDLKKIKLLGKELGADKVTFKTAQFNDYKNGNSLMPSTSKYTRYKPLPPSSHHPINTSTHHPIIPSSHQPISTSAHQHISTSPNSCFRLWSSVVITWDGKVVPCCFDKDAKYAFGDLKAQSFIEIWKSKSIKDFRNQVLRRRKSVDICSNCSQTF